MALWRLVSDSVWASISQQAEQERQEHAAKAAQTKTSRKRLGKSARRSSSNHAPTITPKLPSAKPVAQTAEPNTSQTAATKAGIAPAAANVAPVTNTSGTTPADSNISATNARAVHAPAAVQHAAVNSIMPKASNGSKHVHNWQNNTANKKQASMNDTHSANSYGTQLVPTHARSKITR
jgi:hypothetical protein